MSEIITKLVRCNKCKHEYYICKELGRNIWSGKCNNCGVTDYTVIEDNVKVAYESIKDDTNTQQEDIKHSLSLFKEELSELIKTYVEPFLK